ncbi:MAG TPA: biopolymer transporter ExbD [Azospira sp.]|nr:biopolymer transporter ExbD [Azospira sp.]
MAFASLESGDDDAPLTEINMVPLIDVMLVLLIIFIVTAPLLTHAVKVDLPKAASSANQTRPDNVQLAIDAAGQVFWNGEAVDASAFNARLQAAGIQQPQPEIHIRAERVTPYEKVAQVMSDAARNGLNRIAFVTDPSAAGR